MYLADEDVKWNFASALNDYRADLGKDGFSQRKLAKELGFPPSTVEKWCNPNKPNMPTVYELVYLADEMYITLDELLTGRKPKNVNVCRATGLSSETVDRLKDRDTFTDIYIKHIIEPLLQPEMIAAINHYIYLYSKEKQRNENATIDEVTGDLWIDRADELRLIGITTMLQNLIMERITEAMKEIANRKLAYFAYQDFKSIDKEAKEQP